MTVSLTVWGPLGVTGEQLVLFNHLKFAISYYRGQLVDSGFVIAVIVEPHSRKVRESGCGECGQA
jgi:hypothetical protein